MYASGYRIDRKDGKFVLQKTGMLILSTRPGEAKVSINDKKMSKMTTFPFLPIKINNLLPGSYKVTFAREGYRTWTNSVKVEANLVSWVNYVLLFPKELIFTKVDPLVGKSVLAQSGDRRDLFAVDAANNFYIYNTGNNNLDKVWPKKNQADIKLSKSDILTSDFTQNNGKIILKLKSQNAPVFAIMDLNGTEGTLTYLDKYYSQTFERVEADPVDSGYIFVLLKGNLYRLSLNNPSLPSPIAVNVIDYSAERNRVVYYVQDNTSGTSLNSVNYDGSRKNVVSGAIVKNTDYKFAFSDSENVLLVLPKEEATLTAYMLNGNQKSTTDLGKNITEFKWSENGRFVYYYGGNEVHYYDWDRQKETSSTTPDHIVKLGWYYDENHFMIQTDKELFEEDYDGTNKVNFENLAVLFYLDQRQQNIIFANNKGEFQKFTGNF
jgi:hypothetical protein